LADEIERVRRAEARTGRRPLDTTTLEQNRRRLEALREVVEYGTTDDLKAAMREYGLSEDSPEWAEALRIWNDEREQN
jgi:hypothetical protein